MKRDGFTHREIAAYFDEPLSSVDYRVRLIKAILGRLSRPHLKRIPKKFQDIQAISGY